MLFLWQSEKPTKLMLALGALVLADFEAVDLIVPS
jgi:hypothetical protein